MSTFRLEDSTLGIEDGVGLKDCDPIHDNEFVALICPGEERAKSKAKVLDLLILVFQLSP